MIVSRKEMVTIPWALRQARGMSFMRCCKHSFSSETQVRQPFWACYFLSFPLHLLIHFPLFLTLLGVMGRWPLWTMSPELPYWWIYCLIWPTFKDQKVRVKIWGVFWFPPSFHALSWATTNSVHYHSSFFGLFFALSSLLVFQYLNFFFLTLHLVGNNNFLL